MSIKIGEKKILRSPLEPKDKNWLWLKTVAGFPVLYEYLSGKWTPFSDATAEYMETHILSRVFGSTRYDKDNHCIEFYAADGSEAPIGVIDTSEFEVSIDADDYYTKAEVEEYVSEYVSEHGGSSADLSDYYTKSEVDVLVSGSHSYIAKFTMTVGVGTVNYSCNRTISNLNTAKDSGKVIIGTLGHSVGVLLYCEQQYAVFLFSDTYGELFQMCYNGSWYKQVVETGGSGDIEIDADPTEDSGNAVSSGGVFLALDNKVDKVSGKGLSTNDYTTAEKTKLAGLENYDDSTLQTAIDGKVDKESGKSLMTDAEHTKLQGIAAGAEVNVQPNWAQTDTSADDYIKNKPTIPSKVSDLTNDAGYTTNTGTVTGVSVNGGATQSPTNGVVNLTIGTGGPNDIVGITTTQQGTVIFTKRNNDTVTVDLNHVHPQYLKYELLVDEAAYTALTTKDSSTLYLIPETT